MVEIEEIKQYRKNNKIGIVTTHTVEISKIDLNVLNKEFKRYSIDFDVNKRIATIIIPR